jgi:hypothetical protein
MFLEFAEVGKTECTNDADQRCGIRVEPLGHVANAQ